ncbi:ISL3 family transposase [Actinoplanes sichuanensis]|uniref:ISL3 family transposase n=1 Tax=Actinoplanes sichuanensis TaxID=512349 RepID=UPI002953CDC6|nr:ISL3 family transposase [Actinoplanes sichuanensis]
MAGEAPCPGCGGRSARVHSRYWRILADTAVGGQQTLLKVRTRRFFCDDTACSRRTFAEQVPGVTTPYARRTPLLRGLLEKIALALGGRPGARMTRLLTAEVSRTTLLRLVRALPVPETGTVTVLGVDDFAFRKGSNYGSILVDMHTGRPVDLLPDRLADTFADWLREHPGAEVICRDRASGYAEGGRTGAPDAIQIADRFHLLQNLTKAVDRVVRAHRRCLKDRPESEAVAQPRPSTDAPEGRRVEVTRQRHAEIHALSVKGVGNTAISRVLNLDHKTVLRYLRAATADELLTEVVPRTRDLDKHLAYLAERWEQGCTNAAWLTAELRERGYRGSERTVRRQLQTWRDGSVKPTAVKAVAPKPREVTGWIIRPAVERTDREQADLDRILQRCDSLHTVDQLVSDFGGMLRQRQGQHLDSWITQARSSGVAQLAGFADGLIKDYDAVRNGLTLHWSSGAVEGNVCRLKTIKRQMYGRANFDLLRRRVILAD